MVIEAIGAKLTLPTCLDVDESLTSLGQLGPDKMAIWLYGCVKCQLAICMLIRFVS